MSLHSEVEESRQNKIGQFLKIVKTNARSSQWCSGKNWFA